MFINLLSIRFIFLLFYFTVALCQAQNSYNETERIRWCTVSFAEKQKCKLFAEAVVNQKEKFYKSYRLLDCIQAFNKDECMNLLDEEKVDLTTLDAGEVFVGGRYHSLIPIMQETFPGNRLSYYAVAVIKRGSLQDVNSLHNLRGKRACFAGVGTQAGWVIPVYTLMKHGGMEIVDCNNHVKSTINFFGTSCAVNSLVNKYNPIGDNSDKLCQLCASKVPGQRCTSADPYAGYEGAFRCLVEAGDIAFLKHTTVASVLSIGSTFIGVNKESYELLCRDGSRRTIDEYEICNWGKVPTDAVVTTSAKSPETRVQYQKFLQKSVELFARNLRNSTSYETTDRNGYYDRSNTVETKPLSYQDSFSLFTSSFNGSVHNLLFEDDTQSLIALDEHHQTYVGYLGSALDLIHGVRQCTVSTMKLCVTSEAELEKCIKMRIALKAQLLKPDMICYNGQSHIQCMQAIRENLADVALFDAGDVYTAGLRYELVPFLSEVYNLGAQEYYAVAVTKEEDPSTEITFLKGKYTCHSGMNTGAGWIIPLAYLISNGWMRSYGCNSIRSAAEYFGKSCVPGSLSKEYNTALPYENLCHLCHGSSSRYCRRDASEDYFGHTGAFRCLVEGGGDVAFVKHTTVLENTDGKRREWWARNTLTDDYELLCPDGTRSGVHEYKRCNLGKVKANAIVTRGGYAYNETEVNAFINLFIYAQQFYGRKEQDDFTFSMFSSPPPYTDLIFQDAAQLLKVIPPEKRHYSKYLGKDFMRARRIVDCYAGVGINRIFFPIVLLPIIMTQL